MGSIKIINPGLLTTIQDNGRLYYQQYGIPMAGVMDNYSMQLANILLGNDRYEAVLEITYIGPTIQFNSNSVISITGADISPKINNENIKMYSTVYVNKGDILKFGEIKNGCRAYLSIKGGFNIPKIMGSKSTYLRGKIGGFKGRRLKAGDIIPINDNTNYLGIRKIPNNLIPNYYNEYTARVIMGYQCSRFTKKGIDTFLNSKYIISNQCDRMGYRLNGNKIDHKNGADIISEGITLGTIQVSGEGKPIIMMADRQTTGGYTVIANVISIDIPYIAQLKAGDILRFERINIKEAHKLIKDTEEELIKIKEKFDKEKIKTKGTIKNYLIKVNNRQFNISVQEFN